MRKLEASRAASALDREEVSSAQRLAFSVEEKRRSALHLGLQIEIEGAPRLRVLADGAVLSDNRAVAVDAVLVEAPDGGCVTVRGETSEAQRLADEASDAGRKLEEVLARFGVDTVEWLHRLYESDLERRNLLLSLQRERSAIDQRTTPEIETEVERLETELATLVASRTASSEDLAFAKVSDAEVKAFITAAAGSVEMEESAYESERQNREGNAAQYREASEPGAPDQRGIPECPSAERSRTRTRAGCSRNLHGSTEKCETEKVCAEQACATARGAGECA